MIDWDHGSTRQHAMALHHHAHSPICSQGATLMEDTQTKKNNLFFFLITKNKK